jgi:hypothetical protein
MPNAFDPYREALVVETETVWPEEYDDWSLTARAEIEQRLHAKPEAATDLDYVRMHTGFCRKITVSAADIARVGV